MAENDKKEIKIIYDKSDEFKFIPATGAFGGPNPQGEIICNFFVEYREEPDEVTLQIDSKTGKIEKNVPDPQRPLVRELQIGIVMRPDIARSIGEWLVKEADKVIFQTPEGTQKS